MKRLIAASYYTLYVFDIGMPDPVRSSMGMADIISEMSALATNITLCHDSHLLSLIITT